MRRVPGATSPDCGAPHGGGCPRQQSAGQQTGPQKDIKHRPSGADPPGPEQWFGGQRKGQERDQRSGVAGGVQKIGIIRRRPTAVRVPALDQRRVGGQRGERDADPERKQRQGLRRGRSGRIIAVLQRQGDRQKRQPGPPNQQVHCDLHPRVRQAAEEMRVDVPGDQAGLEKQHRRGPDRRRAAQERQHHLGVHRLDKKQQRRGEKQRQRKQRRSETGGNGLVQNAGLKSTGWIAMHQSPLKTNGGPVGAARGVANPPRPRSTTKLSGNFSSSCHRPVVSA